MKELAEKLKSEALLYAATNPEEELAGDIIKLCDSHIEMYERLEYVEAIAKGARMFYNACAQVSAENVVETHKHAMQGSDTMFDAINAFYERYGWQPDE